MCPPPVRTAHAVVARGADHRMPERHPAAVDLDQPGRLGRCEVGQRYAQPGEIVGPAGTIGRGPGGRARAAPPAAEPPPSGRTPVPAARRPAADGPAVRYRPAGPVVGYGRAPPRPVGLRRCRAGPPPPRRSTAPQTAPTSGKKREETTNRPSLTGRPTTDKDVTCERRTICPSATGYGSGRRVHVNAYAGWHSATVTSVPHSRIGSPTTTVTCPPGTPTPSPAPPGRPPPRQRGAGRHEHARTREPAQTQCIGRRTVRGK
jgi:hypothetical protein